MGLGSKILGVATGGVSTYATDKKFRGGVNDFLFGKAPSVEKLNDLNPQQEQFKGNLLQQLMQMSQPGGAYNQAQNYDQSLLQGGQEGFNQFSQPYNQQFNEQVIPGIEERYAGRGALSSSGFGQALGGAASSFQSQLAQLFSSLQGQAAGRQQNQYNNQSQLALNPSHTNYENPGYEGAAPQFLSSFIKQFMGG
jgi:hypothetical protein